MEEAESMEEAECMEERAEGFGYAHSIQGGEPGEGYVGMTLRAPCGGRRDKCRRNELQELGQRGWMVVC